MRNFTAKFASFIIAFGALTISGQTTKVGQTISFKENKGQICDQNYNPRPDVLFSGNANGLNFHLTQSGISYQLSEVKSWKEISDEKTKAKFKVSTESSIYRVDVSWVNCNLNSKIEKSNISDEIENYYLQQCPNGALGVKSFRDITYKEIYQGIDLKWYQKNNSLEYDFIVAPNADYSKIRLKIEGGEKLVINSRGDLVIKTPFGEIIEQAPMAYQKDKVISSKWLLKDNVVSFELSAYDHSLPLIIDPVIRNWGTYYGGVGSEYIYGSTTDSNGNIYVTGNTSTSNLFATTGAHQTNIVGGPLSGFLTKFNMSGVRQWGTYYGGAGATFGQSCAAFSGNEIYMTGYTTSTVNISTVSSHQQNHGGGTEDGFLVKFNGSGVRQWATFYGSVGNDRILGCTTDVVGNIFICGNTVSSVGTSIATAGAHQATSGSNIDGFLVKFNNSGTRLWGTYYGGTGNQETAYSCATDNSNNVYISGESNSGGTVIATVGSHQPNNSGGAADAFLAKFNLNGTRIWSTFYGSNGYDQSVFCAVDLNNDVYITGITNSATSTLIASAGSHQTTYGGGPFDSFLAKFSNTGVRQWGTYYGGFQTEYAVACVTDAVPNVYLVGYTNSSNGISTSGSYQNTKIGNDDTYIVQFNTSGVRQWGTYYGGSGYDYAYTACWNVNGIHFGGTTTSPTTTNIASPGSHQTTYGGSTYDAFLVQLFECNNPNSPNNVTPVSNQSICANNSVTLSATAAGTVGWYTNLTGGSSLASGTTFVTPTLTAGSYTYFAEAFTCTNSISRTPITFTVLPLPIMSVAASPSVLCDGQPNNATITVSGALTYSWSTNASGTNIIVSPTITTSYSVIGTNANGCSDSYSISILVSPCTSILNSDTLSEILLVIYPNPTSGDLYINLEQQSELVISNTLGQIQHEIKLNKGKNNLNLQNLSEGIYFLTIKQNEIIINKKIIKK